MIGKSIIPYFFILIISVYTYGQNTTTSQNNQFWNNVSFGGGLGLSFGNDFFSGTIAPSAIYNFNEYFAIGTGLNGTYVKDDIYKATIVGGSILSLVNPIPEIQISVEFEELKVFRSYEYNGIEDKENYWYPALFIGAGYNTGNVTLGIRYDILYNNRKSIYANSYMPFVRFYF